MGTELVNKETGEIKKAEPTASERFTAMVINEFKGNVGELIRLLSEWYLSN